MSFKNVRFPLEIRVGMSGTVSFFTAIARAALSQRTQRDTRRDTPLRSFRVERAIRTADDSLLRAFFAFCRVMTGPGDTFRFRDPSDYTVISGEGVFYYLGNNRYQMQKRYTVGAYTVDCDILCPVSGSIAVPGYTETTHYTVDYTTATGVLTMLGSPSPAAPASWTGEYDLHCRFENDDIPFMINDPGLIETQPIGIIEEPNES